VTTRTVATSSVSTSTKAVTTTVITTPTKVTISPIPAQYINLPKYTRSADNVILQNALIARGYLAPGLNTGYYGEMTAIAVVKYKQSLGSSASNTITQPPVQTATVSKTPSKTVVIPTSYEKIPLYSRGAAVTELQKLLVSAGYLNAAYVTGYYGQLTKAAFDAYKAKANTTSVAPTISPKTTTTKTVATTTTKTSPIVVPKAVTATTTVFTRTMSEGSTGADVLALKTFLNTRGFTVTSSGNTYDAATTKAVAQFQRVYSAVLSDPSGIVGESGTVGVATLKLINQINAKK
jgi:peptidoglycan hydrolase-like protein with peptidoglycan-binding domain